MSLGLRALKRRGEQDDLPSVGEVGDCEPRGWPPDPPPCWVAVMELKLSYHIMST